MTKTFYLRFERTDSLHKAGDRMVVNSDVVRIGQRDDCEIPLPNATQFEDALYAFIKRRDEGGWTLVAASPFREHEVRVNGVAVTGACLLQQGDRLSFAGVQQELSFGLVEGDIQSAVGVTYQKKGFPKALAALLAVVPLLLCVLLVGYIRNSQESKQLTDEMIAEARESVYQLTVDSVSLFLVTPSDTLLVRRCACGVSGSAFLTVDSLLVTARHCVEPWLNAPDLELNDTALIEPAWVRWALKAETYNQLSTDSSRLELVSLCSMVQSGEQQDVIATFRSTDFTIDKSRDNIIEYGDFDHRYFWRSIAGRPRRVDMMLGDFAFMRVDTGLLPHPCGNLTLASREQLRAMNESANWVLTIFGFPESEYAGITSAEKSQDEMRHPLLIDSDGYPSTLIGHNGQIGHGFSGGPVLWREGNKCFVVGLVSVTDRKNNNRTYSVPVTEIERVRTR